MREDDQFLSRREVAGFQSENSRAFPGALPVDGLGLGRPNRLFTFGGSDIGEKLNCSQEKKQSLLLER